MINNKFISSKSVIEDVYRNTAIQDTINYEDCTYWIYEALGLANQPLQFIRKVTGHKENPNLDITDYRAELPCDIYRIEQMAVNGSSVRYSGNTFHHLLSGNCCGVNNGTSSAQDVFFDNFGNQFSPQSSAVAGSPVNDVVTFDINNNYITLSVREGQVCIAYLAFPTDKNGFPMIPDIVSYKVAVTKYLIMKLSYIDWIKDPSSAGKKAVFDYNEREWMWYVGKATSDAKIPHLEQMESIKNAMQRLIPKANFHNDFHRSEGAQELRKIS